MRHRLQNDSNVFLPLDGLLTAFERRIRSPVFADHHEADRAQTLRRGLGCSLHTKKPTSQDNPAYPWLLIGDDERPLLGALLARAAEKVSEYLDRHSLAADLIRVGHEKGGHGGCCVILDYETRDARLFIRASHLPCLT